MTSSYKQDPRNSEFRNLKSSELTELITHLLGLLDKKSDLRVLEDSAITHDIPSLIDSKVVSGLFNQDRIKGLPTRLVALDTKLGGIRTQTCTILAGSTGMGKSLISLAILVNLAKDGHKVCYFDLENGTQQSAERLLRIWFGLGQVFFDDLTNMEKLDSMYKQMGNVTYYSHDHLNTYAEKGKGVSLLIALMKQQVKNGCKVFLIDPLQALENEIDSANNYNEQGYIVKEFKEFAQTYDCAVIICHHMRKSTAGGGQWVADIDDAEEIKYRIPSIDDLKGSGKIADYATDVWGMVRTMNSPIAENRGRILLRVLKNRTGEKGDIRLYMDENTLRVTDVSSINNQYIGKDANDIFNGEI